jgi:hypothetical protein
MNQTTLNSLAVFPEQLEAHYAAIPENFKNWGPASWDGIPSERFTSIEQVCHVRDIEIDGYHVRLHRVLHSHDQQHLAGLQWLLGKIEAPRGFTELGS